MKIFWRFLDVVIGGAFIFATDIDNYKILAWPVGVGLAFYLPWLEILCGLALVFRVLYRGGLSILNALVLVFIAATVAAKARGLDISCGCFGHVSKNWSFTGHLLVDLAILVALAALLLREKRLEKLVRAPRVEANIAA
jgi:putative oxidoreductase